MGDSSHRSEGEGCLAWWSRRALAALCCWTKLAPWKGATVVVVVLLLESLRGVVVVVVAATAALSGAAAAIPVSRERLRRRSRLDSVCATISSCLPRNESR